MSRDIKYRYAFAFKNIYTDVRIKLNEKGRQKLEKLIESEELQLSEEQLSRIDNIIESYAEKPGGLIPMLEQIQFYLGYIPLSIQERISKKASIPESKIYGVVSFYSFFTTQPRGRHRIQVCLGTACYVKGAKEIVKKIEEKYGVKPGECTGDKRFTFETARCFGACGLAPVMIVDGKVYGKVNADMVDEILNQYE